MTNLITRKSLHAFFSFTIALCDIVLKLSRLVAYLGLRSKRNIIFFKQETRESNTCGPKSRLQSAPC